MNISAQPVLPSTLNDELVRDYLKQHPDFLIDHSDLLESLRVSQGVIGATSMLERQVTVLRDKNKQLEKQLDDLIRAARSNEQIMKRLQHLTLELLRADNLDGLLSTTQDVLRDDFNADFVAFRLFHDSTEIDLPGLHHVKTSHPIMKEFDGLFRTLKPACGPCRDTQLNFLFRENGPRIKSVALIPLQANHSIGLLALGSLEAERFHNGMGTVFLSLLGELIATAIAQHIEH